MKRLLVLTAVATVLASARTAVAVPVVPNFTQGSMQSTTETTSTISETINSIDYNTGYQYVITGTNIKHDGASVSAPSITTGTNTIEGVTSTWTGMDLSNKPNFSIVNPAGSFQYSESYMGPGLATQTIIQRTTTIESVTSTQSTFSQ